MKKFILALVICSAATLANAETPPTEQDYKNLDELKVKIIRMRKEMDRFVKDIMADYPEQGNLLGGFGQDVKVDVYQTDKDIVVKADLPGMDKDKIEITLENNKILKIAGSREIIKNVNAPGVVRQERMQGKFERILELPAEGMSQGISATYKSGVLEITIPKKKITKEEKVKIKVQ